MPANSHHRFKRPLSDGFLLGAIVLIIIVICALPSLAVIARGIR